jgi:radical SAM superfamily enzyme YgiQ (UPF0313 family)
MLQSQADQNSTAPVLVLVSVHLEESPEAVPLGAACIASALKAAFPPPALSLTLLESFAPQGAAPLSEKILALHPEGAGFSLYSWNRHIMLESAAVLRAAQPGIFLFCGGPEATAVPEGLTIDQGGPFDALIAGEGELAVVRLIKERFFSVDETTAAGSAPVPAAPSIMASSIPAPSLTEAELAALPSPWLDAALDGIFATGNRGALWELTRGCPFHCAYCYESKGSRAVRRFPDDRLQKELALFVRKKIPYIFVLDPCFNIDNDRALKILDMIEKESRKNKEAIHWHFEIRGELITRSQARAFTRLGASLQIGLQTGDPKVSALAGRDLDRKLFSSKINILNQEGAIFGLDLIYGLPGDSLAGYLCSLDYALSLYPNNLDMFRLSVLPGTEMADRAAEFGLKAEKEAPYNIISTPDFSAADLAKAEKVSGAADIFYNRGRAVAWFNQILKPLKLRPSLFIERFAAYLEIAVPGFASVITDSEIPLPDSQGIENLQLIFLEKQYAKKNHILPALRDIVRWHGAWGRALAEGISTDLDFTYDPERVLSEEALDLENFVRTVKPNPKRITVKPE